MSDFGTFGSFTTARLGMYAAQKGLSVTGNNIANINTRGYTRQALDQASLRVGGHDRYQSQYNTTVGCGVLCVGISQLRDPYLDIRYRTEAANVGALDAKLSGLDQLASILDEVAKNKGDGILEKQLTDLMGALQDLSTGAGQDELDNAVRSAAATLVQNLNSYAKRLEEVAQGSTAELRQDINTVNGILTNIRDLNASIRQSEIHGDQALEQRDARNILIDELSQYIKIDVTYGTEDIGDGQTVEKLMIKMGNANPDGSVTTDQSPLIDGIYATQLLTPKANPAYTPDLDPEDVNYKPPYLTIGNEATSDPRQAAQEFNRNFDIVLGALTTASGTVQSQSTIQNVPGDFAGHIGEDPTNSYEYDEVGNLIKKITTSYFADETTTSAKVNGTSATNDILTANNLLRRTIAHAAAGALPPISNGPLTISYADHKFHLLANGTEIGVSAEIGLPTTGTKAVAFQSADGANLGSITLASGAAEGDFTPTAMDTGLAYAAATSETIYYEKTVTTTYTPPVQLADNDLYGSLQSIRELLTEKGEFSSTADMTIDPNATIKRGIPYYQKMLDALTNQIATQFNGANSGCQVDQEGNYLDKDGKILTLTYTDTTTAPPTEMTTKLSKDTVLTDDMKAALVDGGYVVKDAAGNPVDADGNPTTDPAEQIADLNAYLQAKGNYLGGPLFSNQGDGNGTEGITAANISIAKGWADGNWRIVSNFVKPTDLDAPSQANDNILHMIALFTTKLDYTTSRTAPGDPDSTIDSTYFHGTFQEMLANITGTLGDDISVTSTMLDNSYASAVELDTSRDSVSSVDLNDEAMSMMQYQKSYSAACRLMTTLDETLDKLINGTGVVGR